MEHPPSVVARSYNLAVASVLPTNCPIKRGMCSLEPALDRASKAKDHPHDPAEASRRMPAENTFKDAVHRRTNGVALGDQSLLLILAVFSSMGGMPTIRWAKTELNMR